MSAAYQSTGSARTQQSQSHHHPQHMQPGNNPSQYVYPNQLQQPQMMYNNMPQPAQQPLGGSSSGSNVVGNGSGGGGGLLYNNLIPGHYRYGVKPPEPPPGPLSYSNTSQSSSSHAVKQNQHSMQSKSSSSNSSSTRYRNTSQNIDDGSSLFDIIQVSEPDDEEDDDLLVVATPSSMEDANDEDDDEQYYRPFRHTTNDNDSSGGNKNNNVSNNNSNNKTSSTKKKKKNKNKPSHHKLSKQNIIQEEKKTTKPVDLLAVLLYSCHPNRQVVDENGKQEDITALMSEATLKSQMARSLTNALVTKKQEGVTVAESNTGAENTRKNMGGVVNNNNNSDNTDLYATTANAHTEAALSFQRVYRTLLGLDCSSNATAAAATVSSASRRTLSPSEELAKSMLILANMHGRMAKSLGVMGVKWNMGKLDSKSGRMIVTTEDSETSSGSSDGKSKKNEGTSSNGKSSKGIQSGGSPTKSCTANVSPTTTMTISGNNNNGIDSNSTATSSPETLQHERLRMAVRGALDTTNHEEDITNSTFLARSTLMNNAAKVNNNNNNTTAKSSNVKSTSATRSNKKNMLTGRGLGLNMMNRVVEGTQGHQNDDNPVDDL